MSSFGLMIIIVLILTLIGSAVLVFITVKYYWGVRGTPPLSGAEKRRQREEELKLRARQIEYARQNPIAPRKSDFWDNSKVFKNKDSK
jgi:hypothetical protein